MSAKTNCVLFDIKSNNNNFSFYKKKTINQYYYTFVKRNMVIYKSGQYDLISSVLI